MSSYLQHLNALAGGLFLLCTFGMVATRQVRGCLRMFAGQALFLVASALMLSGLLQSWHLLAVALINLLAKPVLIPWLLRRTLGSEVNTRREVVQALNIPTSLLIALALALGAWFLAQPLLRAAPDPEPYLAVNLPIGLAGVLVGAYTATVRREALPLLLGLLGMENSAFFAGIAIAPTLPLIAELAFASDVLILAFIAGVLTRTVHEHVGTTRVGELTRLKEETRP